MLNEELGPANGEVSEVPKICQMCGTTNEDAVESCSECGNPLTGDAKRPEDPPPKGEASQPKARTVLGMPAVDVAAAVRAQPVVANRSAEAKVAKAPVQKSPANENKNARTVLGMAAVRSDQLPSQKKDFKPPMAVLSAKQPTARAQEGSPSPPKSPPKSPGKAKGIAGDKNKTMLGMASLGALDSGGKPEIKDVPKERPVSGREEKRPEKAAEDVPPKKDFQAAASSEVDESPAKNKQPTSKPIATTEENSDKLGDWSQDETETRPKPSGLLVAAIIAGVVVVIAGIIAVAYLFAQRGGQTFDTQVLPTADGRGLTVAFSFPNAPAGSTIEAGGATQPIVEGAARVDIDLSSLKLGKNDIKAIYREPGRAPSEGVLPIVLRHNVTTDLAGLTAKEPFVEVKFQVAPEIGLAIDGEKVPLSSGMYTHKIRLGDIEKSAEKSGDNLIHRVAFQLNSGEGKAEQGQHVITIPVTKMQIDRPADGAIVAADTVTCAGVTEPGAQVTVNGELVSVTSAGFNRIVPLSTFGEHPLQIVAKIAGKAPNTQTVSITRIESLKDAIKAWAKDLDTRLDYPTIGRNPSSYLDKKVKMSGRIVNISTERGVTGFLLYIAEGCPVGGRCAVYVVFRGETDAGLQSWVDIYGRVKGTRGVDLPNGSKLDVPAVEAKFVTKSAREKRRKKRQ